jgi:hypothetical protein
MSLVDGVSGPLLHSPEEFEDRLRLLLRDAAPRQRLTAGSPIASCRQPQGEAHLRKVTSSRAGAISENFPAQLGTP